MGAELFHNLSRLSMHHVEGSKTFVFYTKIHSFPKRTNSKVEEDLAPKFLCAQHTFFLLYHISLMHNHVLH